MRLPVLAPRAEPVPERADARVALPQAMALVDAGHAQALAGFLDALRHDRVVHVTYGDFEMRAAEARVDVDRAQTFADALGDARVVLVGAVIPALFAPRVTIAFAHTPSPATFPDAARAVRDCLDAVFSSARPELARNLAETWLRPL